MFWKKKTVEDFNNEKQSVVTAIERELEKLRDISDEINSRKAANTLEIARLQEENTALVKMNLTNGEITEQIHNTLIKNR